MEVEESRELEELLKNGPRRLLDRLKEEPDPEPLVGLLWEAALSAAVGRALQKSAKKALYALRSGGVDVDRYKPAQKPGPGLGLGPVEVGERQDVSRALLSVPDSLGNSQLIIELEGPGGSSHTLYRFLINTLSGVLQVSSTGGSRKVLRQVLGDDAFFPVSAEYARFRLHRALGRTERSRVSGLSSLPSVLEGGSGPVEHPARALSGTRLSRIVNPDEERKLFTLPEIGGMTLPEEEVGEFRRQVADARESRLVLRNMTPEERVQEILSRFYRLYFIRERLEDLSTRLLDTALALHRRGMHHYTKLLVDYADSLLQPGPAMERHPLLNFLVYKTFLAPRT